MIFKLLLPLFFIIFLVESRFDFVRVGFAGNFSGEISPLEILQSIILVLIIVLNIKNRRLFLKYSNNFVFNLRIGIFLILLYEENSFITKGISKIFSSLNYQNEINLHNMNFLLNTISISNNISITYNSLFYSLSLILLGYGSYWPLHNKFKVIFLERKFSIYFLIYFFVIVFNSFYINYFEFSNGKPLVEHEFLELLIYVIFWMDTRTKVLKFKSKTIKS